MDKKHKIAMSITIGVICFILFVIMFMQFKTVGETNLTSIEDMREEELRTEMTSWKTKFDEAEAKLEETQKTLGEYKNNADTSQKSAETLEQELLTANMILR